MVEPVVADDAAPVVLDLGDPHRGVLQRLPPAPRRDDQLAHLGHPMDTQSITRTVPTTAGNLAIRRQGGQRLGLRIAGPIPPLTTAVMNVLLGKELSRTHPQRFRAVARTFRQAPRRGMHEAIQSIMLHRKGWTHFSPGSECRL
ncbi:MULTISPECIES: hypothetical protein [unclassified Rhodococcus (in: high G+C Gram-positive bacteria)]|uniref:hypothetical protein n=1 Tax=unclassified Rhodococcus (in: high G+C Gram-positive bacteria) TaxID=192944 RepID=UPI0020789E09|nr:MULTISPECIES: hypothetical protein [unclassified Rhodococcus (in: high G+C Gram-positive bacteria)]